jgi:transcriptional regulator with PAS, ATPase and Fis domain
VGAERPIDIDIRLLASTNRDLEAEVKKGRFRQDLFFRINVFPLVIPPLRERKEDIPLLAGHFLKRFREKFKSPVSEFTPRALKYLSMFDWPGNVRELENEVERAMVLSVNEKRICVAHLSEKIVTMARQASSEKAGQLKLKDATQRLERKMVSDALKQSDGNRSKAARILGLTRQGLLNKIDRYQIEK